MKTMEAGSMKPLINIGKSGVTDRIVSEIKEQMKGKDVIKIRILRNAPVSTADNTSVDAIGVIAGEVASKTGFNLVEVRGRTAILSR